MEIIKHPAKYNDAFLPIFAQYLQEYVKVLDPMAGTGKIAQIRQFGWNGHLICNEIEPEWRNNLYLIDEWHFDDASNLSWCEDSSIDAICTSPTYGNRMADHHHAKDTSHRITYTHYLGHDLNEENTGKMQWGEQYRQKHLAIWKECYRILRNQGLFILNISNHIRKGKMINVCKWHTQICKDLNFHLMKELRIQTPRSRYGENYEKRVTSEKILIFQKEKS